MPIRWDGLHKMLRGTRRTPSGGLEPAAPLILAAWHCTSTMEKQRRFREHIEWAAEQGQLVEVADYLRGLSETEWCHFGEV
jgi:hypothetical protein